MDSSIVTDSISDALTRTRALLLTERDFARWLKYGFIAMLGASVARGGGGGGANFQIPTGPSGGEGGHWSGPRDVGPEVLDAFRAAIEWLGANLAGLLVLAVGLITVWIVLWLVVFYIRSVFRFIFVDAIASPEEPGIGESWHRHTGQGLSLLLWYLLLGLVPLMLAIIALIPILSSIGLLASGKPLGAVLGIGGMFGLMGLIFFAVLLLAIGRALTDDLLVPAMYVRRCGVVAGWRHVARAWRGQLGNVVLFYLLKLLMAIGAAVVMAIVGLVSLVLLILPAASMAGAVGLIALSGMDPQAAAMIFGGPALIALILGGLVFGYIVNVALLPVSVFFQAYSLAFVGKLDASLRTI